MEEKNKKEFLALLAMLAEAYNEKPSKERSKIYWEFLKEYSLENISCAFNQAISELKFFPKIAEIKEFILERRPNYNYYPDFVAIEYKDAVSPEKAKEILREIQNKIEAIEPREIKPILEGEAALEFERKREIAKQKAKRLFS